MSAKANLSWEQIWQGAAPRFDQSEPNLLLLEYLKDIEPSSTDETWFLPLCGRSIDIDFLLRTGRKVVMNDFCQDPVISVFQRCKIEYSLRKEQGFLCLDSEKLFGYVGDFFRISKYWVSRCNHSYDRAGMVIFDKPQREEYARTLANLHNSGHQYLLVGFDYQSEEIDSKANYPLPLPFKEVVDLFSKDYLIEAKSSYTSEQPFLHTLYLMTKK
ncbi:hypothetical protein HOF92_13215 [bacterium]|jgi:thiopurine S-methyltransferase|nr:hypothetical protein [bacterium]